METNIFQIEFDCIIYSRVIQYLFFFQEISAMLQGTVLPVSANNLQTSLPVHLLVYISLFVYYCMNVLMA